VICLQACTDAVIIQQPFAVTRVFSCDNIDLAKNLDSPGADIVEITDRGRDQKQAG